jgi:mono/diheme cytochrome c family protein
MRAHTGKRTAPPAVVLAAAAIIACVALPGNTDRPSQALIFLPGTQPGTADTVAVPASACGGCHSPADGRDVRISREWSGSMMAQSARDPLFHAALAVTNKYGAAAGQNFGEYCIRCHSPSGWLAGRSEDGTGGSLRGTDLDGVQCDYCHRVVDPAHPDSTVPVTLYPAPGYGNGMHVIQSSGSVRRGPRDGAAAAHPAVADTFQRSGSFCGVCHDVSNPFHTGGLDRVFLPPHAYSPLERTYSEWLMSAFPSEGPGATCQGCHMPKYAGYAASIAGAPAREDVGAHDLTGGNTFIPPILPDFWTGLDTAALGDAVLRARATLGRAAVLSGSASREAGLLTATVRVTNLTGHKLPTGYPEGRRMWLTVVATDSGGDTVFASASYDAATASLLRDPYARVYEAVLGLSDSAAAALGLPPGPSFHFALTDTVLLDNRIPPRGFTNAGFASRLASPVGASYPDGVSWDEATYPLPPSAARVHASLWYQTSSREYIEFLRDENEGNVFDRDGWGARLYDAWERHGRSAPALVDSLSFTVADTVTSAGPGVALPAGYRLDPPYPNPFNGAVSLRYALPGAGGLDVDVVDLSGRIVAVLARGPRPPGEGTLTFSPSALAGGVYIVRMKSGAFSSSRKILFIR